MHNNSNKGVTSNFFTIPLPLALTLPVFILVLGFGYADWRLKPLQERIQAAKSNLSSYSKQPVLDGKSTNPLISSSPPKSSSSKSPTSSVRPILTTNSVETETSSASQNSDRILTLQEKVFNFEKDRLDLETKIMTGFVQLLGGIFVALTAYVAWQNLQATRKNVEIAEDNLRTSEAKQLTERFTSAVNQLGSDGEDKITIRLGGIYALERIAKDSENDHWTIMEVITAFVREKSLSLKQEYLSQINEQLRQPQDIQAILTVLKRRNLNKDKDGVLDLKKTNLRYADLSGINFSGANLEDTDLRDTDLSDTDFSEANLRGARLKGAKRNDKTKFDAAWEIVYQSLNGIVGVNYYDSLNGLRINPLTERLKVNIISLHKELSGANLSEVYLHEGSFEGSNLSQVNFTHSILEVVEFEDTNLSEANFSDSKLAYCRFRGADLRKANFRGADLTGCKLSGAKFEDTDFTGANLQKADLSRVDFKEIIIDPMTTKLDEKWRLVYELFIEKKEFKDLGGKDISGAYLPSINLSGVNLSGVNLSGAYLRRAKLSGADLSGADLSGVDLSRASLDGANLDGANLDGVDLGKLSPRLTREQIKIAKNWENAIYDDESRQELGLASKPIQTT
jgi:uncharacterized protein YjbI with pentapeptide repeats